MPIIILQARLDSSRLPGKSLLPLGGEPLILRVMEALSRFQAIRVLACPQDCVIAFSPLAKRAGFAIFAGSKEDVLARYAQALRHFQAKEPSAWIIRATGDNPFVLTDAAQTLYQEAVALDADYAGYAGLPCGAGVEVVKAASLLRADDEAAAPLEREHVCPYLYGHPELFLLHRPLAPPQWQGAHLRLTVDTREDYERAQALYAALSQDPRTAGNSHHIITTAQELFR